MDDSISRQDAIDAIKELCLHYTPTKSVYHPHMDFVIEELTNLPPVQPERPGGKWIPQEGWDGNEYYKCSACGVLWVFTDGTPEENGANFCPEGGADMRGAEK